MKTIRFCFGVAMIWLILFSTGCAVPAMSLRHDARVQATYKTKGNLKVEKLNDLRTENEKILNQTAVNKLTPQIWSGNTSPEMLMYFQTVLELEAKNTGLFNIADGDFILSGDVTSLKVDRTCTALRYIPLLNFFEFSKLEATVTFDARLSKNGAVVFTKSVTHSKSSKFSIMKENSVESISMMATVLLDEAITESIKTLFDAIDQQLM
jgi:hypothetical protein